MPSKTDQTYAIDRAPALNLTADEIAQLDPAGRTQRLDLLLLESRRIFDLAVDELIVQARKDYVGTAALFSGGNDSTALVHAFRPLIDVAIHANTGIGIENTRQHVRATCAAWGIPLLERTGRTSYRNLVIAHGFPGPGQHYKMFQQLKEAAIMRARAELVTAPRRERLVFLAGRRKDESARRSNVPLWEREGSVVWISPFALWTKLDLNTYRRRHTLPQCRAAGLIHMSGECLCGAFAKRGELDEIRAWFPDVADEIETLELSAEIAGNAPAERCRWGWGAYRTGAPQPSRVGALCSSCALGSAVAS